MSVAVIPLTELKRIARQLEEKRFKEQVGPFVLLMRPEKHVLTVEATRKATKMLPILARATPEMVRKEVASFDAIMLPPVREADRITVGRGAENDVVLEDVAASKNHAEFDWDGKVCKVKDLGAKNKVFVNAYPINGEKALADADVIALGGEDFIYFGAQKLYWLLVTE